MHLLSESAESLEQAQALLKELSMSSQQVRLRISSPADAQDLEAAHAIAIMQLHACTAQKADQGTMREGGRIELCVS